VNVPTDCDDMCPIGWEDTSAVVLCVVVLVSYFMIGNTSPLYISAGGGAVMCDIYVGSRSEAVELLEVILSGVYATLRHNKLEVTV